MAAPMTRAARHRTLYLKWLEHADVCLKILAGAGGFEPPHGGIKVRCLTTWLRPNGPSGGAARPHIVGHTLASNPSRIGPEYVVRNGRSVACRPQCRAAATALAGALLEGYKAALAQHNPLQGVFGRCPFGLTVGRSVAQPGSALASGARGREFESPRSDQLPASSLPIPRQFPGWAIAASPSVH